MRLKLIIILFIFSAWESNAQDIHFSQFYTSPLNMNPANTGLFMGKFRVGINSKHQWSSITVPYKTISGFFDASLLKRRHRKDALGIGALINTDIAGDSKFSTLSAGIALNYIRSLSFRNNQYIAIGILPSILQKSIDYSALYYDNQYNGNRFDPDIPHNELTGKKTLLNFDMGVGIQYYYYISKDKYINPGFSIWHVSKPSLALKEDPSIRTDLKYIIHFSSKIPASTSIDAYPMLMFAKQGSFMEINFGALLKYNRNKNYHDETSLNFGLFYRYADALVVTTGFDYKNVNLGVSYDINLSKLRPASRVRGGLEFAISYIFDKNKSRRVKEITCPIF